MATQGKNILKEGRNCWRISPARRTAFLIDAADYFNAFVSAVEQARHSVFIIGWDVSARLRLHRSEESRAVPDELESFLAALLCRRPELNVYVLEWDFAVVFALERDLLPVFNLGWDSHSRLHFALDSCHPVGGSHHQKIVVVDDCLAFVGGLDLTRRRWDTPEHNAEDPRRVDPEGRSYRPFHDVQIAVEGDAAAALGELARQRWHRATGERLSSPGSADSCWPSHLEPDLENVPVAIARTQPAYEEAKAVQEIKALYLDAFAAAHRSIYIENQYVTSATLADALAARLREENGPEVILALPYGCDGWLEEITVGVLRHAFLHRLREADRFNRLRVCYPIIPGLGDAYLNLHAKVLIVDDQLARIGSSNLSNRSLGLDTECDLAIEANGDQFVQVSIARLRHRLLGEHLGVDAEKVAALERGKGSLLAVLDSLRGGERTLELLPEDDARWADVAIPAAALLDPEKPLSPERLLNEFLPEDTPRSSRYRAGALVLFLLILIGLAAAWRWTSLGEGLSLQNLAAWGAGLRQSPATPLLVIGVYLFASLLAVPITLLIALTAIAFAPPVSFAYALVGSVLAAMLTYGIGYFMGRATVRRLAGTRLNRLSRRLGRRGLITVITARILPLAPFSIVNVVAGASHIRFRDFALGTAIGLLPGIIVLTLLGNRLVNAIRHPDLGSFVWLAAAVALVAIGLRYLPGWLSERGSAAERARSHVPGD